MSFTAYSESFRMHSRRFYYVLFFGVYVQVFDDDQLLDGTLQLILLVKAHIEVIYSIPGVGNHPGKQVLLVDLVIAFLYFLNQ